MSMSRLERIETLRLCESRIRALRQDLEAEARIEYNEVELRQLMAIQDKEVMHTNPTM